MIRPRKRCEITFSRQSPIVATSSAQQVQADGVSFLDEDSRFRRPLIHKVKAAMPTTEPVAPIAMGFPDAMAAGMADKPRAMEPLGGAGLKKISSDVL